MLFEAEVRHKPLTGEDVLTSRVIGVLDLVDRRCLTAVLRRLTGDDEGADEAELAFWKQFEGTEPDALLTTGARAIVIEAKLDAPLAAEQLVREWRVVDHAHPNLATQVVALTKDARQPDAVAEAQAELAREHGAPEGVVSWRRWADVADTYDKLTADPSLDATSCRLLQEVLRYMEVKGVRGFQPLTAAEIAGFRALWGDAPETFVKLRSVCEDVADVSGGAYAPIAKRGFFRAGSSRDYTWPEQWRPTTLEFLFDWTHWQGVEMFESDLRELYLFCRHDLIAGRAICGVGWLLAEDRLNGLLSSQLGELTERAAAAQLSLGVTSWYRDWNLDPQPVDPDEPLSLSTLKPSDYDAWRLELVQLIEWEAFTSADVALQVAAALQAATKAAEDAGLGLAAVKGYRARMEGSGAPGAGEAPDRPRRES